MNSKSLEDPGGSQMHAKVLFAVCVVLLLCICGCRPVVQDDTIHYWTGTGWYHEQKTPEEMMKDLDDCETLARQKDDPFLKKECMMDRGYELK
jgi:hypothetical protein